MGWYYLIRNWDFPKQMVPICENDYLLSIFVLLKKLRSSAIQMNFRPSLNPSVFNGMGNIQVTNVPK